MSSYYQQMPKAKTKTFRELAIARANQRMKASAIAQLEKAVKSRKSTLPPVLIEINKRLAASQAIGLVQTKWQTFAPMVNIQTSGTVQPFVAYEYQVGLIEAIEANQNTVICKSRQMGISECVCSWMLMRALTEPGFSAVVFSKTQADASELGRRIRGMALSLGLLCPKLETESATKLAFGGLGKIYFLPVTARAARGIPSVSVVLFDEAAFIDGIDGVYQAAIPTLSMLGDRARVILNSTPNGRTGLFFKMLAAGTGEPKRIIEAIAGISRTVDTADHTRTWIHQKWAKVFLHWRSHPVYGADPNWADKTRVERHLTQAQWDQEYELDFGVSGRFVFNAQTVEPLEVGAWATPQDGHRYIAGLDPSFGGADYFTLRVWDVTDYPHQLVAQYHENYKGKDIYTAKSLELIDLYDPFTVGVETNGGGKLYLEEFIKVRPYLNVEGVIMSSQSKLLHTDRLVLMQERSQLHYPPGAAEEYAHFVEMIRGSSRTRAAESGWHDDTVMADAIAFACFQEDQYSAADLLEAFVS